MKRKQGGYGTLTSEILMSASDPRRRSGPPMPTCQWRTLNQRSSWRIDLHLQVSWRWNSACCDNSQRSSGFVQPFPDLHAPIMDMTRPWWCPVKPSLVRLGSHTKAFHSWLVSGKSWRRRSTEARKPFQGLDRQSAGLWYLPRRCQDMPFPFLPSALFTGL